MKTILTTLIIGLFIVPSVFSKEFECSDPRKKHVLIVGKKTMKILNTNKGREIASIKKVQTKLTASGFTKSAMSAGLKHIVHIENTDSLKSLNDYLIIRDEKGHEITYPLECQERS